MQLTQFLHLAECQAHSPAASLLPPLQDIEHLPSGTPLPIVVVHITQSNTQPGPPAVQPETPNYNQPIQTHSLAHLQYIKDHTAHNLAQLQYDQKPPTTANPHQTHSLAHLQYIKDQVQVPAPEESAGWRICCEVQLSSQRPCSTQPGPTAVRPEPPNPFTHTAWPTCSTSKTRSRSQLLKNLLVGASAVKYS
jgi:hypothetical protein